MSDISCAPSKCNTCPARAACVGAGKSDNGIFIILCG
jgi:hypothetical protein